MDYFQIAYDAIEAWVAEHRSDYDNGRWFDVVPSDQWGATKEAWQATATEIVGDFNTRIAPDEIDVTAVTKNKLRDRRLADFHIYLAAKAQGDAAGIEEIEQ